MLPPLNPSLAAKFSCKNLYAVCVTTDKTDAFRWALFQPHHDCSTRNVVGTLYDIHAQTKNNWAYRRQEVNLIDTLAVVAISLVDLSEYGRPEDIADQIHGYVRAVDPPKHAHIQQDETADYVWLCDALWSMTDAGFLIAEKQIRTEFFTLFSLKRFVWKSKPDMPIFVASKYVERS